MNEADFDQYAEDYQAIMEENLQGFGRNIAYYAEYKVKVVRRALPCTPARILEYGCGVGRTAPFLRQHFPDSEVWGCDVSDASLSIAAKENPGLRVFSTREGVPEDAKEGFDLVFVANVFHHIAPSSRAASMEEVSTFCRRPGDVFLFEHNPYNPLVRRVVKDCPFDADARLLRPCEAVELMAGAGIRIVRRRFTLFFPAALGRLRPLERLLGMAPLGGQYYVHGRLEPE